MCSATEFKFCTCLNREINKSEPHWVLYSASHKNPISIKTGVIYQEIRVGPFDFEDFEQRVEASLRSNTLFDFDYKPRDLDLIHIVLPDLRYNVTFQYHDIEDADHFWMNLKFGFDSMDDFKIKRLIQGEVKFN